MPLPLTSRDFAKVDGEWVQVHRDEAPEHCYATVHIYQGNKELDRYTLKDAHRDVGIPMKVLEAAFKSPPPEPKKAAAKAEKPAAKKAAAKADK